MKKPVTYILIVVVCITSVTMLISRDFNRSETNTFAIQPVISDGYDEIFGDENETSGSYGADDTASVTYDLAVDDNDPVKGYITAQIDLLINGKSCSASVSGEAEAMELTNDKYWEGCLRGDLYVEGDVYDDIYVYFSKLDSRDDIQMSLSVSTEHGSTSFTFGNLLLDEQEYSEIESHRNYGNNLANYDTTEAIDSYSIYQPIPGSEYSIIGNGFTNFSYGSLQYYSQRVRAYYNSNGNRLAISLKTYANDLSNYMEQNGGYYNASYVTGIHEMTSTLTRVNSNDYSFIVNIQNPGLFYNGSYNVSNVNLFLYNFFYATRFGFLILDFGSICLFYNMKEINFHIKKISSIKMATCAIPAKVPVMNLLIFVDSRIFLYWIYQSKNIINKNIQDI